MEGLASRIEPVTNAAERGRLDRSNDNSGFAAHARPTDVAVAEPATLRGVIFS